MIIFKLLLFFSLFFITSPCEAQRITTADFASTPIVRNIKGDTVKELGHHLMHILQDKKGNYWYGSWGEGVFRYDGKSIIRYCLEAGKCDDSIVQMVEDKLGNLYFNTHSGLYKYDGNTITTMHVAAYSKNEWRLSPDDLWFKGAQDSGCIFRYDGKILHRLTFPKTPEGEAHIKNFPRSQFPHATFSPYDVYTIIKDSKGNLWFGTGTLGACRYDGKSFKWISASECGHPELNFGIRSIIEDRDGKFWFSKNMYRFDFYSNDVVTNKTSWYQKEDVTGNAEVMREEDFIYFLSGTLDQHGHLWMATYNDGVYRYDGKNITHYPVRDGERNVTVFTICLDEHKDLWLGTHEKGVFKFDGKEFKRF